MANELEVFTAQQKTLSTFIDKGKAISAGTGYGGTAPSYADLAVDITGLASTAFKSKDIYRPGTNIAYKEAFDSVASHIRFSNSIGNSRADYYAQATRELDKLGSLHTYTQNVISKLSEVPS